jgi:plastocyanin
MEDKCPECGETLLTKTIRKKLGSGSIDYPIAATCPKCKWSKDLTGAGDIAAKPVMSDAGTPMEEEVRSTKHPISNATPPKLLQSPVGINTLIPFILAILVLGAIAYVFFINTGENEQGIIPPTSVPTPAITQTPVRTPAPTPEVTASGKQLHVKLDTDKGFTPRTNTIKLGDKIVWTNEGTYAVTLVSSEDLFGDKFLNNAKRTDYTFLKTGQFNFYLKDEKNMTGTIVVEP